ncbi:MAG: transketolase [Acinetobacter sp.]|nr:transketolase [Acinetobacter sp.]
MGLITMTNNLVRDLRKKSAELRLEIINMIFRAKKGHIGGAYSCLDLMVCLYYGNVLNISPDSQHEIERDIFILSKGHSGIAQYVILADLGFFSKNELQNFNHEGSFLGEHPDKNIPGIEADTGSLGHGLGIAVGFAFASKIGQIKRNIYVIVGDGECYEGTVWESMLFANHHNLDNLTIIVDRNYQITLDFTEECNSLDPLNKKFESFGMNIFTTEGHDHAEILKTLQKVNQNKNGKPNLILANTIKGKGVSFMEGKLKWHHGLPNEEEKNIALEELNKELQLYV